MTRGERRWRRGIGGCSSKRNGDLWLLKREGSELHGRIVSREGLRREFPHLYDELLASNNKDCPRVVVER